MTINVQLVYGAGNDTMFGGCLRDLRAAVIAEFGNQVYVPRILDYTEGETLNRLMAKWNDPTVLVGHSCGCMTITAAAMKNSMKRVPYLLACAPSIYCPVQPLVANVAKATQATSWWGDFFNPGGRTLLHKASANARTQLDVINTGMSHLQTPCSQAVRKRLLSEIALALETYK